ncbi:MAG: hypothetical protein UFG06_07405 [Lachnospiraceae bacterium]|nr:hypothetical protein [Lachnospiraceae bacterium]
MKTGRFVVTTVLLVLITAFLAAGTVKSQSRDAVKENENYYLKLEREYVRIMREYLNEAGFENSGVMLTRTVWEDGSREYRITVHNSRFLNMTEEEKAALAGELEEKAFQEQNCSFIHSFTGNA